MSWTRGRGPDSRVSVSLKIRVLKTYGPWCYLCQNVYHQIDHVVPWSLGGATTLDNLRPICRVCHKAKTELERRAGYQARMALRKRPQEPHPSEG